MPFPHLSSPLTGVEGIINLSWSEKRADGEGLVSTLSCCRPPGNWGALPPGALRGEQSQDSDFGAPPSGRNLRPPYGQPGLIV